MYEHGGSFFGKLYYFLTDHLGSTRVIVDSTGAVKSWFDYHPYGTLRASQVTTVDTKHRYTGKEHDGDDILNQDYFGARYLHGNTLRFTTVDPQAARYPGWSPYCYALGNPIRLKDSEGEAVEDFVYGLAAAVLNNFTIGGSPRPDPQNYPSSGRTDLQIGLAVGDVVSFFGGAGQTLVGSEATVAAVATSPAGGLSLAAIPATAGFAAHGVGVVATSATNIGKDLTVLRSGEASGDDPQKQSQGQRQDFAKVRSDFWKREAAQHPSMYSTDNLNRMSNGKPPIGPDGKPMELHHKIPLAKGGTNDLDNLEIMSRQEHRIGESYRRNHPMD